MNSLEHSNKIGGLIALYGGAFDPPHNGHVSVLTFLAEQPEIREVWVVPSGDRPDKRGASPAAVRLELTQLMVNECVSSGGPISVRDYHATHKTNGIGTIDLLRYCQSQFPSLSFGIVIGAELVKDLRSWKQIDDLRREGVFIVVSRPQADFDENKLQDYKYISFVDRSYDEVSISSSEIRRLVREGHSVESFVPSSVGEAIRRKKLYQNQDLLK